MKKFQIYNSKFIRVIETIFDFIIVISTFLLSNLIYNIAVNNSEWDFFEYLTKLENYLLIPGIIVANSTYIFLLFIFFFTFDTSIFKNTLSKIITSVIISFLIASFSFIGISAILRIEETSILLVFLVFLIEIFVFIIWKSFTISIFKKYISKKAVVLGSNEDIEIFREKFLAQKNINIIQFIQLKSNYIEDLKSSLDEIDILYVLPNMDYKIKDDIVSYCTAVRNIEIGLIPRMYEVGIVNSNLEHVSDLMIYNIRPLQISFFDSLIKRVFDLIVSISAIIIFAPIIIIFYLIILITEGRPVFYIQERLTKNSKKYNLIKFRSMKKDAEAITGAVWSIENDPRITKLGKFIRKTRIDELPQVFNVLKGEMSIVGPRPEREIFSKKFSTNNPEFDYRLNTKAGITGLAQVYGKYNTHPNDKLRYDLYYIRNYSIFLDIKIILLTIKTIFDSDSTQGVKKQ